ncbi:MAG: DUF4124 domain-containing protein [Pseudomonadaceae bacterium]|nr:DUF4124 domain-containing protein [Pseudomonadaceae bacterium]
MNTRVLLLAMCLAPMLAQAQAYKCIDKDGHVTYSQSACDDPTGTVKALDIQTSFGPELPPVKPGNEHERLQVAVDWAIQRYPALKTNEQAITETIALRDSYISGGEQPAEAMVRAAKSVGAKYLSAEVADRSNAYSDEMRKTSEVVRSSEPHGGVTVADSSRSPEAIQHKINVQISAIRSQAANAVGRGKPSLAKDLNEAADNLSAAPPIKDVLSLASDASTMADRGKGQDALHLAEKAASFSPSWRPRQREESKAKSGGINQGVIDVKTGQFMPGVAGGIIDPRTGKFYPDVGAGYIDNETGRFIPKQ